MADEPTTDKPQTDSALQPEAQALQEPRRIERIPAPIRRVAYRANRLFGEALSVTLALGVAVLFFAAGLVSRQSADLTALRPNVQQWFSQGFNGAQAELGDLEVRWNPSDDTVSLRATDVTVYDRAGTAIQTVPLIRVTTTKADILARRASIQSIDIVGGIVTWRQDIDGTVTAGLGTPNTVGRFGPVYRGRSETASGARMDWLSGFTSVNLTNSRAHVVQEEDGLDLVLDVETLTGFRQNQGAELTLDGRVARNGASEPEVGGRISVALQTIDGFETTTLSVSTQALNPSELAPSTGRLSSLSDINVPLNVDLGAVRARDGSILSADLTLSAAAGEVLIAGRRQPVEQVRFKGTLDPGDEIMTIETLSVNAERLRLSGSGVLREIGRLYDGNIGTSPKFDLVLTDSYLDMRPIFERPITSSTSEAIGEIDLDSRRLSFDSLKARFKGVAIDLSGEIVTGPEGVSRLAMKGHSRTPMTAPDILSLWPVQMGGGARRWIDRSVLDGRVEALKFDINLDEDFFVDPKLTSERLQLDFTVRDGIVRYISTMDPLTDAVGTGRIDGNRFGLVLESGRINGVDIVGGDVDIPRLLPKGGDILISVQARGPSSELLSIINQPPFQYLDKYGVDPQGFGGQADIVLSIKRPLLEYYDENRIEYEVQGRFIDASAPFELGGHSLNSANVSIRGGKGGLFLEGPANIGPWRVDLSWAERYGQNGEPTRYRISGPMDRKTLDGFGIGFRQLYGGVMDVDIEASGAGVNISDAIIDIDLGQAELSFGDVYSKSVGELGELRAIVQREDDRYTLPRIALEAPGLELVGQVSLREGLALEEVRLDTAKVEGLIDGQLVLSRDDAVGRLALDASGRSLNLSNFVRDALVSAGGENNLFALSLDAAFDEITLAPDYVLGNAAMTYRHNGTTIESMSLQGERPDGPLIATLTERADKTRKAHIRVPDVSIAASRILALEATRGGALTIRADLPVSGMEGPVIGQGTMVDFDVRDAPFLAQILSLASLTGIFDTLSGDGLRFDQLSYDFALQDRVLSVRDAKLRGPSIGMTGDGEIELDSREVDFSGALVPAYTANSLLGDIPLLGDIFVGKDGEGVFAVNYAVEGPFSSARISINPLSALTPGFIRGIFREQREDLPDSVIEDIESVRPDETAQEDEDR